MSGTLPADWRDVLDDDRATANSKTFEAFVSAQPFLEDVVPAGAAIPELAERLILTSGAPLPWNEYRGGQRTGILGAALFEGWASTMQEAEALLDAGEIRVGACHEYGAVGSVTGVYSPSIPVLVVRDRTSGRAAFCSVYEGSQRQRLTYGVWNPAVRANLVKLRDVVGPTLGDVLRHHGPVDLARIMRKGLLMGDDLHSRNTASTSLLVRELAHTFALASRSRPEVLTALEFLSGSDLFFLHVGMAAGKVTADAAHGVPHSSLVTAMAMSSREFSIRVSGLGDEWFRAPLPPFHGRYFAGFSEEDRGDMGGESLIMETNGFGGLASAAAFPLQDYSGGSPEWMIENSRRMYAITFGESPTYKVPFLGQGVPVGIDIFSVVATGITPTIHAGAAHKDGGHIGAGVFHAPIAAFVDAVARYREVYSLHDLSL